MNATKQMLSLVVLMASLLFSAEILADHKGNERSGWENRYEHTDKSKKPHRQKYKQDHRRNRHGDRRHEYVAYRDDRYPDKRHERRRPHQPHEGHHHSYNRGMSVLLSVGEPGKWFYSFGLND